MGGVSCGSSCTRRDMQAEHNDTAPCCCAGYVVENQPRDISLRIWVIKYELRLYSLHCFSTSFS